MVLRLSLLVGYVGIGLHGAQPNSDADEVPRPTVAGILLSERLGFTVELTQSEQPVYASVASGEVHLALEGWGYALYNKGGLLPVSAIQISMPLMVACMRF